MHCYSLRNYTLKTFKLPAAITCGFGQRGLRILGPVHESVRDLLYFTHTLYKTSNMEPNPSFNHTQLDPPHIYAVMQSMRDKVSIAVLNDMGFIIIKYGTIDAEIMFNKYFNVHEVDAPQVFRFLSGNDKMTTLFYKGPENPRVPASVIIDREIVNN